MAYKPDHITTFDPTRVIQPIYTGGAVSLTGDGNILATTLDEDVLISTLSQGQVLARVEGDGEAITTLALSPDAQWLVTCSRSLSMRVYNLRSHGDDKQQIEATLSRTIKPHTAPVVTLAIDATSSLLATGGADGIVKVWDLRGGFTTHTFHGHSGLVSALHFFEVDPADVPVKSKKSKKVVQQETEESTTGYRLASGDEEGKIRIWDLHKRKCCAVLDSHVSVVRGLHYSAQRGILLSGSRDKTVVVWSSATWEARSTVPILEDVESVGFITDGQYFFTGGERGRLRVWTVATGTETTTDQEPGVETEAILQVLTHPELPFVLSIHADQVMKLHSLQPLLSASGAQIHPLPILRQISGTHDEVIDLAYVGRQRDILALATNLEDIRLVSLNDSKDAYFGADIGLLKGHSDIIITMAIDWSGHWLATGAKDNTARLWRLDSKNSSYECYATFTGHAESIGAVALPNSTPQADSAAFQNPLDHSPTFLLTGSTDKTVKKWDISAQGKSVRAKWTRKAHDKDINALATSYAGTNPLFASASQDRTVKIWDVEAGEAVAVLRGHKRGVWTVAFSPPQTPNLTTSQAGGASGSKGMILTGSGDKTVRIWSLTDYTCIRTFEGHANSILKVVWLPIVRDGNVHSRKGVQVASAAGDGLVKVWDAESGEVSATLDNHIDRVWALAVKPSTNDSDPITLVSGSADSTITFWTDTTESSAQEATTRATARVEQDQELQNHIRSSNYREAIVLALQLNHPKRLLEIFTKVVDGQSEPASFIGSLAVDDALRQLSDGQLWSLLQRCRDWNANARTSQVAQRILWSLLHMYPKEHLLRLRSKRKAPEPKVDTELTEAMANLTTVDKRAQKESMKDVLDALKAYTERHDQRLAKLGEERFVLTWALQTMDGYSTDVTMINGS
ncbi:hypothetical protein AMS68_002183 [Peltaster fructicola]|uniref:U3 small nucleolar RNA-associated protein 13 C-terminal domain-containing protein n=1 Tax=Peltaster fructicola TaxID=286661 RepID=A0A6H0XPQ4_9PEZI|nr:hypothetical protein AMS68_002183 [Peltaster fructicola]